ncbi:hypothetical protein CC80DRAFT_391897, partial [Byssothecium circinans]
FAGKEFSNNLLSDLAPLLTLFGEQVTKHFLSMSLGWFDHFLLAVGPLGIITILVSAIRVGGSRRLKAVVGRSRESRAKVEAELMTSTSDEVCELWDGREIVRVVGVADSKDFLVHLQQKQAGIPPRRKQWTFPTFGYYNHRDGPPNLSLNLLASTPGRSEKFLWVCFSIAAQYSTLILPAHWIYQFNWRNDGDLGQSYAYPLYSVGCIFVFFGVIYYSRIIEAQSLKMKIIDLPVNRNHARFFTIQRAVRVGDQQYDSYLLIHDNNKARGLRTSRPTTQNLRAAIATLVTLAGFMCQFVGLRTMHWSTTLLTLYITIIMTGVRVWARR